MNANGVETVLSREFEYQSQETQKVDILYPQQQKVQERLDQSLLSVGCEYSRFDSNVR